MKLLVISHSCITPINQEFYAFVERISDWQIDIVVPSNWKNDYSSQMMPERWPSYKGQLIQIPVLKPGSIPLHTYSSIFISLLRECNPHAIYVHNEPYALSTVQIYLANKFSINRPIGCYSAQNIQKQYPFPFRQAEQWILKVSDFAFPVSQEVKSILRDKGFQGNLQYLPLGVDFDTYFPRSEGVQIAQKYRRFDQEILIGFLGRITEEKGLKTLLHALKHIQDLPWRLVMAGSGNYETEFYSLAKQLGLSDRILSLGYIPHNEAPIYLSMFDLLVLPSETRANWKEQFGRVIIEALACGTPVIGSDSGEIPHLLKVTGGGLIFPEANDRTLAEQLKQLILNAELRKVLALQGQKVVKEKFTYESISRTFIQTIEESVKNQTSKSVMK